MKKTLDYRPPKAILEKYADLLVNFALGGGRGIMKGGSDLTNPSTETGALSCRKSFDFLLKFTHELN
ncbi:MAG: hypothetical protein NT077_00780 [Candidatus Taylorbacteria bacterium]|nr:hypothetical protein [Candidatus Taylorbacteria bacterium]